MGTESPQLTPELKPGKERPGWEERGQCKLGVLVDKAGLVCPSQAGDRGALPEPSGEAARIQQAAVWMCRAQAQLHLGLRTPESGR